MAGMGGLIRLNGDVLPEQQVLLDPFEYPGTREGWKEWYLYRHDAYVGDTYSLGLQEAAQLFFAVDPDGDMLAQTRRLGRDVQHVVDTGAGALAGGALSLQVAADAPVDVLGEARTIWRRSRVAREKGRYARILCGLGDLFLEPVRQAGRKPYQTRIVWYAPYNVEVEYDDAGLSIIKAVIETQYHQPATVDVYGVVHELGNKDVLRRVLTNTRIDVYLNDKRIEAVSGEHGLGVVPLVHIPCISFCDVEHSLWVGHALDRPRAEVDSLLSQASAIGKRYANPTRVFQAAEVDGASGRFGRDIEIKGANADKASVYYLEVEAKGLKALLDAAFRTLDDVRQTLPEFLFAGAGANVSGEALKVMFTRFETKYLPIQANLYDGLARATEMAVAMERGEPYDPDVDLLIVTGPPLLPANVKAELEAVAAADDLGAVNDLDKVRHSQRLGIANGDVSAEDYLADLQETAGAGDDLQRRVELAAADIQAARETIAALDGEVPKTLQALLEDLQTALDDAAEALSGDDDDDDDGAGEE